MKLGLHIKINVRYNLEEKKSTQTAGTRKSDKQRSILLIQSVSKKISIKGRKINGIKVIFVLRFGSNFVVFMDRVRFRKMIDILYKRTTCIINTEFIV